MLKAHFLWKDQVGFHERLEKEQYRDRWVRFSHTLLNMESAKLDPTVVERLRLWPVALLLRGALTVMEAAEAVHAMVYGTALGPDDFPAEMFKLRPGS